MVVVVCAVSYAVDVRSVEFLSAGCEGAEEGEDVVLGVAADPCSRAQSIRPNPRSQAEK